MDAGETGTSLQIDFEETDRLLLDPSNPRLASVSEQNNLTQVDLLRLLWEQMQVEELLLSISANGFFPGEPLLVIPAERPDRWVVVEGNRRLAAVLLLRSPELRAELGVPLPDDWGTGKGMSLDRLPVVRYPSRYDVWAVCGVRHVNGPRRWEAIDKAQYIARVHEEMGIPVAEIIRKIGDTFSTVSRMYNGYLVLRQGEQRGIWRREESNRRGRRFEFSLLYTAVAQPEYQNFLGLQLGEAEPVPADHLPQLKELLVWLYGDRSQGIPPVVGSQNPDLNRLREVLARPLALSTLRSGAPLAVAHERTRSDEVRLNEALGLAAELLKDAKGVVMTGFHNSQEAYELAGTCHRLAGALLADMEGLRREQRS